MSGINSRTICICLALTLMVLLIGLSCAGQTPSATPTQSKPAAVAPATAAPAKTTAASPTPQYGGTLKILSPGTVTTFGLPSVMRPDGEMACYGALESLAYFDLTGEFIPKLATKWEIGQDGKSVTLILRKGVKFHDGTDFNAESAKANLDQVRAVRGELKDVTSVEIVDPYTIRLNLNKYNNVLVTHLSAIVGKTISPTALLKNGEEWAKTHPVGTGPYKFKDFQRDVFIKYERFDDYWGGKPYLDAMERVFKADKPTALMAFKAGEGQILMSPSPKDTVDLKSQGTNIVFTHATQTFMAPSSANSNSPFAKVQVRQAVEYAIDREAIAAGPGYNYWQANYSIMPPDVIGYNKNNVRKFDPAKAKQLLAEAGYPNGFKTTFYSATPVSDAIVPIITYLKAVGIEATLESAPYTKIAAMMKEGWEGLLWGGYGVDPNNFHRIEGDLGVRQGQFISTFRPPAFQATLDEGMAALTLESRTALSGKLDQVVFDNVMIIPVYRDAQISAYGSSIGYCNLNAQHFVHWSPEKTWLSK